MNIQIQISIEWIDQLLQGPIVKNNVISLLILLAFFVFENGLHWAGRIESPSKSTD